MQDKDDQMLLFEKLSAGLFDCMILMVLCILRMVHWKYDEQQLKEDRQNVVVYLVQLQQAKLELKVTEDMLRQVEETCDELTVQLRETKGVFIGLEGDQRRQKNSPPSSVTETVEGYESPFWKSFRGTVGENQGELGRNFGSAKARRVTILVQDHEGVYSQMNETEKFFKTFPECLEKTSHMICREYTTEHGQW
jgi:hypothetical protein